MKEWPGSFVGFFFVKNEGVACKLCWLLLCFLGLMTNEGGGLVFNICSILLEGEARFFSTTFGGWSVNYEYYYQNIEQCSFIICFFTFFSVLYL